MLIGRNAIDSRSLYTEVRAASAKVSGMTVLLILWCLSIATDATVLLVSGLHCMPLTIACIVPTNPLDK